MQHIKLFIITLNLILGFSLYSYFTFQFSKYGFIVIKRLGEYTMIMSLLLAVYFVYLYARLNLPELWNLMNSYNTKMIIQLIVSILIVLMIDRIFLIYFNSIGRYRTHINNISISVIIITLALAYIIKLILIRYNLPYKLLGIILLFIFENIMVLEIPVLIYFIINRKKIRSFNRSINILFLFMFFKYVLILTILLPEQYRLLPGIIFTTLLITLPYLWLRIVFLPELKQLSDRRDERINLIRNEYGISERESEIIMLVISGKSNKEIENKLFISGHTVKNHLYNIYQKLGIKSRGELFRIFYG